MGTWFFQHKKKAISNIAAILIYFACIVFLGVSSLHRGINDLLTLCLQFIPFVISIFFIMFDPNTKDSFDVITFSPTGISSRRWFKITYVEWENVIDICMTQIYVKKNFKDKLVDKLAIYAENNDKESYIEIYMDNRLEIINCISQYYALDSTLQFDEQF